MAGPRSEGCKLKIAVCSDTHLGHKSQQLTSLKKFYAYAKSQGCKYVLHAGDLLDGMSMRKGHNYECFISGSDEALAYVESVYPDDCETLIIGGNHDYSFFKHHQQDLLKLLSRLRPDIHYLGMHKAAFRVHGMEVAMFHGSGMGAASNRLTRTYSNACRDGPKPDLVVNGHLHHWNLCPEYGKRKALLVQAACFQGTTQYERSIDKIPQIGGMVVWRDEEAEKMVYEIKNFDEVRHDHPGLIIDDYPEPIIDDS